MALETAILALIATAVEVVSGQLSDRGRHHDSYWSEHSMSARRFLLRYSSHEHVHVPDWLDRPRRE